MKQYVVTKPSGAYLKLLGPFQYPSWVPSATEAERMSYGKASQCAAAFGGNVMPAGDGIAAMLGGAL